MGASEASDTKFILKKKSSSTQNQENTIESFFSVVIIFDFFQF